MTSNKEDIYSVRYVENDPETRVLASGDGEFVNIFRAEPVLNKIMGSVSIG